VNSTLVRAARLFDGAGRVVTDSPAVLVDGEQIAAVGAEAVALGAERSARLLDFPNGTLLPGLIDCHVHLVLPGDGTPAHQAVVGRPEGLLLLRAAANARRSLESGVTTLRDCGARDGVTFALREAIELGIVPGPRLVLSGRPITQTGGHMHFFGGEADGADGVRRLARELLKEGADFLKIVASGGGTPGTVQHWPSYTPEEIHAAADVAHRAHKPITAHAMPLEAVRMALDAGVDGIEHVAFLGPDGQASYDADVARTMRERGTVVSPTLPVNYRGLEQLQAKAATGPLTREETLFVEERLRLRAAYLANFGRLLEQGVRLVASTDAGWGMTPFGDFPLALELMAQAGMPPTDILTAATGGAADAIGIGASVGALRPGRQADLLVAAGDPTSDVSAVRRPLLVMKAGTAIDRGEIGFSPESPGST
jgi:imidazolonepropionase-like amidohydrolase